MRERRRFVGLSAFCIISLGLRGRRIEQLACPRDVLGARGAGEETVVADAVEASWQDVDEEATDELARGERHDLVAGAAVGSIVLVFEGDALLVERDQPAVGSSSFWVPRLSPDKARQQRTKSRSALALNGFGFHLGASMPSTRSLSLPVSDDAYALGARFGNPCLTL